ncbi:MAG: hypothetical protein SFY67_06720 [Candidatus Melainabacteria bacterium]|nr:hypothetical protein [Candidatus Melainabacteria bacterium]
MNAGIENNHANFSGECGPCPATFDLISPDDFASFRPNRQQNITDQRIPSRPPSPAFSTSFSLNQIRPNNMMRQDMFMQPNMVRNNCHQLYDSYWKNYWQEHYKRADWLTPTQRWKDESWTNESYENEDFEYEEDHSPLPQRHRPDPWTKERPGERPRPLFDESQERPSRPQFDRTNGITQAARDFVGQQLFKFIPGTPGRLGCAASVSAALNKAGFNYARHAGVAGLARILENNGWTKHSGLQDAKPGDVVVIVRRAGWQNGGGGSHIGIVGENGKVYHNSSSRQQWIEDSLQRVFGGGIQRFILRPPRT